MASKNYYYLLPLFDGGVKSPAARTDILQWLKGMESDGLTISDRVNPLVVDEPEVRDVNCLISTGAQTISNANISNGAVVVNAGTAVGTATAGVITFTSGTISQVSLDGVMTYTCEEGLGFPNDVSGLGNHITSMTTTWTTSDSLPSWNHSDGFYQVSNAYQVTEPNGGYDRDYNPNTASLGEAFDVLATVINDSTGSSIGSWSVTAPSGGLLRTYNPNTVTTGIFLDVLATIANDIAGTASAYTLTEPSGGRVRTYNPNTDSVSVAYDVLGSLLLDMQEAGYIG